MARAKRHYIPGQIWDITHRCHKQEFLLKFAKDRRRWLTWLFEARKRYGLVILDYTVTSNLLPIPVRWYDVEIPHVLDLRRPEAQDWFFHFFRAGDGAVRVVAVDAERIEVTDYLSQEKIKAESKSIGLVFPRSLCDNIRDRAGLR